MRLILCLEIARTKTYPVMVGSVQVGGGGALFPFAHVHHCANMISDATLLALGVLAGVGARLSVWQFLMQRPWMSLKRFPNTRHFPVVADIRPDYKLAPASKR